MPVPEIRIAHPEWISSFVDFKRPYATDRERMRLAVALARENVLRGTGGPFGAAIFEEGSGRLVAVGTNSVTRLNNSVLHAEVVAFMTAQSRLSSFTLHAPGLPEHMLATSCEPCAMCLGATLWSGVRRLLCGAAREDAERLGFDEGPVYPASYEHLRRRGIGVEFGMLRREASEVMELYVDRGGPVYNP